MLWPTLGYLRQVLAKFVNVMIPLCRHWSSCFASCMTTRVICCIRIRYCFCKHLTHSDRLMYMCVSKHTKHTMWFILGEMNHLAQQIWIILKIPESHQHPRVITLQSKLQYYLSYNCILSCPTRQSYSNWSTTLIELALFMLCNWLSAMVVCLFFTYSYLD